MFTSAVILGLVISAGSAAAPDERVEVRRARVSVVLDARSGGSCADPDPAWVTVTEDKVEAKVTGIEPILGARRTGDVLVSPTLHVLMFDTSPSMMPQLDVAFEAARAYVEALRPGEAAMLATFDDRFVLLQEPTVDREAVLRTIEHLELGLGTVLWRSVDELLTYLDVYPGRKVVAVITDGCDSLYPAGPAPLDVIARASRTAETTFYPIALDAPQRCPGSFPLDPRVLLRGLASRTGGECFEIGSAKELGGRLGRIRARLDREAWLTYVPPEVTGAGAERVIRVRTAHSAPCEVRLAASSIRVEPDQALAPSRIAWAPAEDGAVFKGTVTGKHDEREVVVPVPTLAVVRREDTFAAVLAMRTVDAPPDPPEDQYGAPFVVEGAMLLDLLPDLAAALYERPDYRVWARERIARRRLGLLEGVVEPDDPALAGYRAWLASPDWQPRTSERAAVLGAWLGDLDAAVVAAAVDRYLARDRLSGAATPEEAERRWRTFLRWLDPPDDGTELGLLIPAYRSASDVVGFHRVILPAPGRPDDRSVAVPARPLATRLAAFAAAAIEGPPPEIRGARYHAVSRAEARALGEAAIAAGGDAPKFVRKRAIAVMVRVAFDGAEETVIGWFRTAGRKHRRAVEDLPFAWSAEPSGEIRARLREAGGPADVVLVAPFEAIDDPGGR